MNPHNNAYPVNTTGENVAPFEMGLSKRELLAAMAMQGYRANSHWAEEDSRVIASWAVQDADALIAELSK